MWGIGGSSVTTNSPKMRGPKGKGWLKSSLKMTSGAKQKRLESNSAENWTEKKGPVTEDIR